MKPNFTMGSFVWWIGRVEDIMDPMQIGRLKVKIYGYYDDIDKDKLPWASVVGPIQSSSFEENGYSPTGCRVGSTVMGFFMDGDDAQVPVVTGTLYGVNDLFPGAVEKKNGKYHKDKKKQWGAGPYKHPGTKFAAKYPDNHTISGHSGTQVEMDNTAGEERIAFQHPKGHWIEMNKDEIIIHSDKDWYLGVKKDQTTIIKQNSDKYVGKNLTLIVDGDVNIKVKGNWTQEVKGNYELKIGGSRNIKVGSSTTEKSSGNHDIKASVINLN